MSTKEHVIRELRRKNQEDKMFSAVFLVLGLRKRSRHSLTVQGLAAKMKEEGFGYTEKQLIPVIQFLGELGLGILDYDNRGVVTGIRDIRLAIPLIGAASCGQKFDMGQMKRLVEPVRSPPQLTAVPKAKEAATPVEEVASTPKGLTKAPAAPSLYAAISLYVNNRPIHTIKLPGGMTLERLAEIVSRIEAVSA